jgi:hypothetical protein
VEGFVEGLENTPHAEEVLEVASVAAVVLRLETNTQASAVHLQSITIRMHVLTYRPKEVQQYL